MSFVKKSIIVNGKNFFYWEKGDATRPSMVLLHGFPGNHAGLLDLANDFKDVWRIIIPDLPSCGLSAELAVAHNLQNYSDWLDDFLKSIGIESAIIIGHSFGARLALVFASRYPKKVQKLVLITPVVKVAGLIARLASVEYKIAQILPAPLKKIWLSYDGHRQIAHAIIFKSSNPALRKKIMANDVKELRRLNPRTNIELFQEFYKFSLLPAGEKVKAPSLVIAGGLDEIAPLRSVKELANQLANVSFELMEHEGHLVPLEQPEATADIIQNFLQS